MPLLEHHVERRGQHVLSRCEPDSGQRGSDDIGSRVRRPRHGSVDVPETNQQSRLYEPVTCQRLHAVERRASFAEDLREPRRASLVVCRIIRIDDFDGSGIDPGAFEARTNVVRRAQQHGSEKLGIKRVGKRFVDPGLLRLREGQHPLARLRPVAEVAKEARGRLAHSVNLSRKR